MTSKTENQNHTHAAPPAHTQTQGPVQTPATPPGPVIEAHPDSEAVYPNPRPKPGDNNWVAGSPATDEEAAATEKAAKERLAEGRKLAENLNKPVDTRR
jgi:hypothetical protein